MVDAMLISRITPQLRTRDLDSSIRFYTEIVGLALEFRYSDFYAGIRAGDQLFHLKLADVPDPSIRTCSTAIISISTSGPMTWMPWPRRLTAKGVTLQQQPQNTAWQTRELVFLDDQGHTIYVGQDTSGSAA